MGFRQDVNAPVAPEVQAPEQAPQGRNPEELAQQIVSQVNELKGLVEPDVFANFIKQNIIGGEPEEQQQGDRKSVV